MAFFISATPPVAFFPDFPLFVISSAHTEAESWLVGYLNGHALRWLYYYLQYRYSTTDRKLPITLGTNIVTPPAGLQGTY